MDARKLYARIGLGYMPRLLGLIDRNPYSRTYGCFDRNYWHYKVSDFPSTMYQIAALPLALAYKERFPDSPYRGQERIKDLALAAIRFMGNTLHKDGSGDEFYPFERALGATTIALCRCTEAYLVLGEKHPNIEWMFGRVADWVLENDEPGLMSNHQAAAALGLLNAHLITGKEKYLRGARERIGKFDRLQSKEGWLQEYEGCDPGYLTVAIDFLADYYRKTKDRKVLGILRKAVEFSSYFIHPDGSYGGEYGSRSTQHFISRGFEIIGNEIPLAAQVAGKWLEGVVNGRQEFLEDDRYFIDEPARYLQSYMFFAKRKGRLERKDFRKHFKEAGMYVERKGRYYVVVSLAKGGVMKVFRDGEQVHSDCGLIGVLENGKMVTSQVIDPGNRTEVRPEAVSVEGSLHSVSSALPSPLKSVLFRSGLLTAGRKPRISSLIKSKLTKKLILGKNKEPVTFRRLIEVGDRVRISDRIEIKGKVKVKSLSIGTDFSVIHVPGSRYYQEGCMQEWMNLDKRIGELNREGRIEIERVV
jgi:hypothetical protein